jgi:hypothetical protein
MRYGRIKVGLAIAGAFGAALTLVAQPAFADYAPNSKDVVGVGSDTLQYMLDFIADGDFLGDTGYNSLGNKYKLVNFDATADANARLAYGPNGVGTGTCAPGSGTGVGTGLGAGTGTPCQLNPTIVIRAGVPPVQRPNGSTAGANALAGDTDHYITYARASACEGPTSGCKDILSSAYDSVQLGTDPLAMLVSSTPATNAIALSAEQLKLIYECEGTHSNAGDTISGYYAWNDAAIGGTSSNLIIPLMPQKGSGTRSFFESEIGITDAEVGSCVTTVEENDPTAIAAALSPTTGSADPADAIEPMSGGRLNLWLGDLGTTGGTNGVGGYFHDPTCPLQDIESSTGDGTAACSASASVLTPSVHFLAGTPTDGNPVFNVTRPLYIYFRDTDLHSTTIWQPGGTLNAVNTLFYNPSGTAYDCSAAGQALIAAAGVDPTCVFQAGGP